MKKKFKVRLEKVITYQTYIEVEAADEDSAKDTVSEIWNCEEPEGWKFLRQQGLIMEAVEQ